MSHPTTFILLNQENFEQSSSAFLTNVANVMITLRPDYNVDTLIDSVKAQMQSGYQLAVLMAGERPVTLAGFVISNKLAWRKHLYLDDLVTDESVRGQGYGQKMLNWLKDYAAENDCQQIHLDSGVQRFAAHKLYLNQGYNIASHHFSQML